ncbi:co-chaperone protein p23-1-like [Bidens hawaiensis]|uniref:co-chaperone protein p23-1-like n=1 Tax=Bidens hawaiensis TaxID=980011 RepID=UPI00404A22BC
MSRHPILKWAQRDDLVYITIDLPDAKDVKLKLEPEGKFSFSATSGADNIPYEINIDLYDKVDVNESKASVGSRNIMYLVKKEESKWWTRLIKQEGRTPVFIKVDWNKWVDEDEQAAGPDMEFDDVNFSSLNIGGGGEEDYEDEDESDTEEEIENVTEEQTVSGELGASNGHVEVKS